MRINGCVFGIGVLVLVGATVACAVLAFATTRQVVVDLGNQGVQADSPLVLAEALASGGGLDIAGLPDVITPDADSADFESFVASLPTHTPFPTLPPDTATPTVTLRPNETPLPTFTPTVAPPTSTPDPLAAVAPITDPRRFTVLLLGIDQRTGIDDGEQYFRTDTIMVLSVDPVRRRVGVLSIPRDLWVAIPGYSEQRINTANSLGDSSEYPGGGPALAAATVEQTLGISIDRYLLINFDVFLRTVELLAPDGVEICIPQEIDDPFYPDGSYGFIEVYFEAGCQDLNAERLLQYARTRKTDGGDFDRSRRQHEVMLALRQELLSAGGIANFITQAPALWSELSTSFKTDMTLEELLSLGLLAQDVPRENIHFGVIDNMHVEFATTNTGDQVLLPNYGAVRLLVQQVFYPPDDLELSEILARAQNESAGVVVYNNTEIQGLAGDTRDWLVSQGVTVVSVGNIPEPDSSDTFIRNYTDATWTARYLASLLGIPSDRITRGGDGLTTEDVMVVVGPDMQELLSSDAAATEEAE